MLSASTSGRPIWAAQATGSEAVRAADLGRHDRDRTPPGDHLEVIAQAHALVTARQLLDADGRRADHAERQQQALGIELGELDDRDRAMHAQRLERHERARVDLAAAARAEDRAAARERGHVIDVDAADAAHAPSSNACGKCVRAYSSVM